MKKTVNNIVIFAGQSMDYKDELKVLALNPGVREFLYKIEREIEAEISSPKIAKTGLMEHGMYPGSWATGEIEFPDESYLISSTISQPMLFIVSIANALFYNLFPEDDETIKAYSGHSQGVVSAAIVSEGRGDLTKRAAQVTKYLIWQGIRMQQSFGFCQNDIVHNNLKLTPMVSISRLNRKIIESFINKLPLDSPVDISLENSPDRFVVSAPPENIKRLLELMESTRGKFAPQYLFDSEPLKVSAPFHSRFMLKGRELINRDLELLNVNFHSDSLKRPLFLCHEGKKIENDGDFTKYLMDIQYGMAVNWPKTISSIRKEFNENLTLIIPGPGKGLVKLTSLVTSGSDIKIKENPQSPIVSSSPTPCMNYLGGKFINNYSVFTGKKPVILPGMTPTTATSEIVAATSNAGFVSELAGGGQVTEEIFRKRMVEIKGLLNPGKEIVFNTLYLDPYLYGLHISKAGLVFKLKNEGFPICGLTLTAGIPPIDEAVALITKLNKHGIWLNSLKAGTPEQVEQILKIADKIPQYKLTIQIEGGEGGGHHSWYSLDNLLNRYYSSIRKRKNLFLAVGGGVTPETSEQYLSGKWFGELANRPVDAVFIGTAGMVAKEAETSNQVKKLLANTIGIPKGWTNSWNPKGGLTSGRSSLGATIWYVENSASKMAKLAFDVNSSPIFAKTRKTEIINLLEKTWKPYFGDLDSMTYEETALRFVELTAIGQNGKYEEGIWLSNDHKERFFKLLDRFSQRVENDYNYNKETDPKLLIEELCSKHSKLKKYKLLPQDVDWFLELCDLPGKPLPFVPVIDSDLRKRFLADSLFYSHVQNIDPDKVLIIPGPKSTANITEINRPISEILGDYLKFSSGSLNINSETFQEQIFEIKTGYELKNISCDYGMLSGILLSHMVISNEKETLNPIHKLMTLLEGDLVKVSGDSIKWERNGKIKLELKKNQNILEGYYVIDGPSEPSFSLPIDFSFDERELLPIFNEKKFKEELEKIYKHKTFHTSQSETEYQFLFQRSSKYMDYPFLPWLASNYLGEMLDKLNLPPLGMLHYRSKVKVIKTSNTQNPNFKISNTTSTTNASRIEIEAEQSLFEVEAELIPSNKKSGIRPRPLPPSENSEEVVNFDMELEFGEKTLYAPKTSFPFALVGGDWNPLHTDSGIARYLGLNDFIIHGLWSQGKIFAEFEKVFNSHLNKRSIQSLNTRFLSPVSPGEKLTFKVSRTGRSNGYHVFKSGLFKQSGLPAAESEIISSPLKTAYICPGQGVQKKGMHEPGFSRSESAKEIWTKADRYTISELGFSLLDIVINNPITLEIGNEKVSHPAGVLNLTQFTQVSLVVLACAQVAELKENGVFIEDAAFSGHSLGEYSALSSIGGILSLENVVKTVYHRGLTMQNFVERDKSGRSNYKMGVIRPHHGGITESEMVSLVNRIAEIPNHYIEIVNYNARGKQYAVTGEIPGLEKLEQELGNGIKGKSPYVEVPGIDVPFHSSLLKGGVDAFRTTLDEIFPLSITPDKLVNKYWPNLTGMPFSLDDDYLGKVEELTGSSYIVNVREDLKNKNIDEGKATRIVLLELLAYQFASPVQWINIQEGMVDENYEHVIEIGPGHQPTLTNLFLQSLQTMDVSKKPAILHLENSMKTITGENSEDSYLVFPEQEEKEESGQKPHVDKELPKPNETVSEATIPAKSEVASSGNKTEAINSVDLSLTSLMALLVGAWNHEIDTQSTLEDLLQGNSARRNQMIAEVKKEFNLKKTEGIADLTIKELAERIRSEVGSKYKMPGKVLLAGLNNLLDLLGGVSLNEATSTINSKFLLEETGALSVLIAMTPYSHTGNSRLSGNSNPLTLPVNSKADGLDLILKFASEGHGLKTKPSGYSSGSGSMGKVDAKAVEELKESILGKDGILHKLSQSIIDAGEFSSHVVGFNEKHNNAVKQISKKSGYFDPSLAIEFSSYSNWIKEDIFEFLHQMILGKPYSNEITQRILRRGGDLALSLLNLTLEKNKSFLAPELRKNLIEFINEFKNRPLDTETLFSVEGSEVDIDVSELIFNRNKEPGYAIVTGSGSGSIAEAIICKLLAAGWKVIAGVSTLSEKRAIANAELYRNFGAPGSSLTIVPFKQGDREDTKEFAKWTFELSRNSKNVLLFPFAAMGQNGMSIDLTDNFDLPLRINLLGVSSLVANLSKQFKNHDEGNQIHVILPFSPNLGHMGGDGVYGETKAGLEVLLNKWHSESELKGATIAGARIGWVRGTGLMASQDGFAPEIETRLNIKTFTTEEMASQILKITDNTVKTSCRNSPLIFDITGGISKIPNWGVEVAKIRTEFMQNYNAENSVENKLKKSEVVKLKSAIKLPKRKSRFPKLDKEIINKSIAIVGYGEVGPFGDEESRWNFEVSGKISDSNAIYLAIEMGLIKYDKKINGFVDIETQSEISETEIEHKYFDIIKKGTGIRLRKESGYNKDSYESVEEVKLVRPVIISVDSEEEGRLILNTCKSGVLLEDENGNYSIKLDAGEKIMMPVNRKMRNPVAGMVPDGWDPKRFGFSEVDITDRDRNTLYMLIATMRAFHKAGLNVDELHSKIHPSRIGNALGTGIGGMERLVRLYTDPVLNKKRDPVSLQESLGNVGAGHVSQEILGNYGPMISPVAACATAGISFESAWEKLTLSKADFMVAGATDDLSYAGTVGFDDMAATVDFEEMKKRSISAPRMSRPHDSRRKGFIESQGGGVALLMKTEKAIELGLPIYGIIGGAWSFGDGISKSIPAPGFGILSVAQGGENSTLIRALGQYKLSINDVDLVSMHGTSTGVNDPHESGIYEKLFNYLGRNPSNAVPVISQKGVTGHPKGGAAAFQLNGVLQVFRDEIIPGHRNLENLDKKEQNFDYLIYPKENHTDYFIKSALITTLGFGHVSSMMLIINPSMIYDNLTDPEFKDYIDKVEKRDNPSEREKFKLGLKPLVPLRTEKLWEDEKVEISNLFEGKVK